MRLNMMLGLGEPVRRKFKIDLSCDLDEYLNGLTWKTWVVPTLHKTHFGHKRRAYTFERE